MAYRKKRSASSRRSKRATGYRGKSRRSRSGSARRSGNVLKIVVEQRGPATAADFGVSGQPVVPSQVGPKKSRF